MGKEYPRQRVNGHSQHEGANAQATVRSGVVTVVGTESGTVVKLKPCPFCGDEESLSPSTTQSHNGEIE